MPVLPNNLKSRDEECWQADNIQALDERGVQLGVWCWARLEQRLLGPSTAFSLCMTSLGRPHDLSYEA